jgi:LytS/YehU family sensor histidine kinase
MLPNLTDLLIKHRWFWHLGFWCLYAASRAFPYYLTVMFYERAYLEFMLITDMALIVVVYITWWLYRRFCYTQQYLIYFAISIPFWLVFIGMVISFQKYYLALIPDIANAEWIDIYLNNMSRYMATFIVFTMGKYFKDSFKSQYYEKEKKHLQTQSELQNLKAQISPHFLFNTMNNFYGLAVDQSHKLPELMVRLSDLLRYSLYETNHLKVPLSNEIAYLKNYIELEKIRLEDTLDFEFEISVVGTHQVEIAPLLLVVFVENAFKHAKNVTNDVIRIKIYLAVTTAGLLTFKVENNCVNHSDISPFSEKKGIGLDNVRKRLEAFYPDGLHQLVIEKTGEYFYINLQIRLI